MRLLDVARGAYVRSPSALRRTLAPLVALAPTSLKYGGSYRAYRADIDRSRRDPEFADRSVRAALAALLQSACGTPFYHARFAATCSDAPDFSAFGPEDLVKLPVITKADLRNACEAARAAPRSLLDVSSTSGSNGQEPLTFYLDRCRSVREMAFIMSFWSRAGYRETDARAVFRGFRIEGENGAPYEWEPALRELRLSVFPLGPDEARTYVEQIDAHGIRFIHGYPSAIEIFCRELARLDIRPRKPIKAVFPISEPVYPHQRAAIANVFGDIPVLPFYGLSERTLFAGMLEGETEIYEFEPLYGFPELLDAEGRPVAEGEEGRIVGTGFLSTGMPFVRYDTNDRAVLVRAATRENGWRMRVRALCPRRRPEYLVTADGIRAPMIYLIPDNDEDIRGLQAFQLYQDTPGRCTLRYVRDEGGSAADAMRLRDLLAGEFAGRIQLDIEEVDSIVTGTHGKRPFIEQRLDVTQF